MDSCEPGVCWDHKDRWGPFPYTTPWAVAAELCGGWCKGQCRVAGGRRPSRRERCSRCTFMGAWSAAWISVSQMLCIHSSVLTPATCWGRCWDPTIQTGKLIWNHTQGGAAVKFCQDWTLVSDSFEPGYFTASVECPQMRRGTCSNGKESTRGGRAGVARCCHTVWCGESSLGGRGPRGAPWTTKPGWHCMKEAGPRSQISF